MHKIERNIEKYDLDELPETLRRRRQDGDSLRDLEQVVNIRILERALTKHGGAGVVGDAASLYEILARDDVSAGRRTDVVRQLSNSGVPVDAVERDFVSYETVRAYLQDGLDIDTSQSSPATLESGRNTVEWAQARCTAVVERTLKRLHESDALDAEQTSVTISVRVTCEETGETYRLSEFIDRGGCRRSPEDA